MSIGLVFRSLFALVFSAVIALLTLQHASVPPPSALTAAIDPPGLDPVVIGVQPPQSRVQATPVPGKTVPATPTPRSQMIRAGAVIDLFPNVNGHIIYVGPDQNLWFITGQHKMRNITADGVDNAPALSPDGSQLAYVRFMGSYSDVMVSRLHYEADGAIRGDASVYLTQDSTPPPGLQLVPSPPGYDPRYYWYAVKPSWLPDGQHLLYLSDRPGYDPNNEVKTDLSVWEQGVTDTITNAVKLTTPALGTGGADSPGWRPNDPAVFIYTDYLSLPSGQGRIMTAMAVTGTAPQSAPITLTPYGVTEFQPVWSPDGHYIAFAENEAGGRTDLKVMAYHRPGVLGDYYNAVTVQPGAPYVAQPFWSPDGRYLGYLANSGISGDFEMYVRPVIYPRRKGNPLAFGPPVHLFQAGTVSADYRPTWGAQ